MCTCEGSITSKDNNLKFYIDNVEILLAIWKQKIVYWILHACDTSHKSLVVLQVTLDMEALSVTRHLNIVIIVCNNFLQMIIGNTIYTYDKGSAPWFIVSEIVNLSSSLSL